MVYENENSCIVSHINNNNNNKINKKIASNNQIQNQSINNYLINNINNNSKIKKNKKKIKYEYLIPDYIIKKIISYLMDDGFNDLIICDSSNSNHSSNNYNNYNKYRKSNTIKLKKFNLDFSYSLVCWKWFNITTKMNTFLPLRFLVSIINRNNDKDNNYFYSLLNHHLGAQESASNGVSKMLSNEEKIYKKRKQLLEDEEENKRLSSSSLLYTSLKFGRIQFNYLTEIEFDKILPTWQNSWQLLSNESPNLERISLVIVVGNDSPFDIFEKFPANFTNTIKLSLKLFFNDLYCNLESIDHYTKSSRLPKNLNVEFIHCLCNISQEMNWDIVNFFKPKKLLLDSSYDSTIHYGYSDLFNFYNQQQQQQQINIEDQEETNEIIINNQQQNHQYIQEIVIKSHDFMDLKDFKEAIENNLLSSIECSLLLNDLYCFEHIIPEVGGEAYWDSIAIDTNDESHSVRKYIHDIGMALSNNTSLETLVIHDFY
ncbi:hypothetical protein DICPUDRAFT_91616, partial [Dictyostelium purpureum]